MRHLVSILSMFVLVACNSKPPPNTGKDCPSGQIFEDGECRKLCKDYCDDQGMCCQGGVCRTCDIDPPLITAITGTGTADGAPDHASHHLRDRLVITGEHLADAVVRLEGTEPATDRETLAFCEPPTDTELQVKLPESLVAGRYTLMASNQAGSCDADLRLLEGEPGDVGTELTVESFIANDTDAGYVPYQDGTKLATSGVTYDGEGRVGIGTATPTGSLTVAGNLAQALTGVVTVSGGTTTVFGTGTAFVTELAVGDAIQIAGEVFTVADITDDEELELDASISAGVVDVVASMDADLGVFETSSGIPKVVVDKSGNVGIGTTTPAVRLHVSGATDVDAAISSENTTAAVRWSHYTDDSGHLRWFESNTGTLPVTFMNTGRVGIGTSTPGHRLHVAAPVPVLILQDLDATTPTEMGTYIGFWNLTRQEIGFIGYGNSTNDLLYIRNASSLVVLDSEAHVGIGVSTPNDALDVAGDIDATGCVQADDAGAIGGTCVSDGRLKENIAPLSGSLERVAQLVPVKFDWKDGAKEQGSGVGLVAQEVEEVFPHLVKTDDQGFKRVRYDLELQMHMLTAIKELRAQVQAQQREIRGLRARLNQRP